VEKRETPKEAAARECLEEAGIHARRLKPLVFFHAGLDSLHNPTYLFYTDQYDYRREGVFTDETREVVAHGWIPLAECVRMIFTRKVIDSFSMIAILAYQRLTGTGM